MLLSSRAFLRGVVGASAGAIAVGSGHADCAWPLAAKKRRRVAIYGGAFDPPTNGHLTACAELVHGRAVDEVWLCPCGPRPDKPAMRTPAVDRYVMCELAVNTRFGAAFPVVVKDAETFRGSAMYTYDLLCALRAAHPDCDFAFVVGSDWLQPGTDLRQWTSSDPSDPTGERVIVTGDRLVEEFDFLVVPRPGYDVPAGGLAAFGPRFRWVAPAGGFSLIEPGNISSSELRKRMSQELARDPNRTAPELLDGHTPPAVVSFIQRRGLYR